MALATWVAGLSRRRLAALGAVALAASIMMDELSRLTADALTDAGQSASLKAVLGASALKQRGSWTIWAGLGGRTDDVASWIAWHALIDVAFIVGSGAILLRVLGGTTLARRLVLGLATAELLEAALVATAAACLGGGHVPSLLAVAVAVVAAGKWLLLVALVLTVIRSGEVRTVVLTRVRLLARALKYQRLSLIPVGFVGLLSSLSGPNILDQVPDVERAWVDGHRGLK
ncbi:MAG: hypothetical protein M3P04_04265, partial [Actinomycetota bacterium]|nr:hypothetical protein [Actinomycetota bacterium]